MGYSVHCVNVKSEMPGMSDSTAKRPVLLYVVTEDWYFMSHRLPMARAAKADGWDVHVATRVSAHGAAIEAEGFSLHPLSWRRASLSPLAFLGDVMALRGLYNRLAPRVVHHIAMKPTLIGNLATVGMIDVTCINSLAGMGYVFTSKKLLARALRLPFEIMLSILLNRSNVVNVVQNPDDREALERLGVLPSRIEIIPGSGVDTHQLTATPEPPAPIRVGFVGRMLEDKGVRPLIEAHQLLRERGVHSELWLAGTPDPDNPTSISPAQLEAWGRLPGVERLGHVGDIADFWASCHIAVLPSRREGLPKSLLEAAACGRPIVATDVPGCREIARPDINALLVPPDDAPALSRALQTLIERPDLRRLLGAGSRRLVEREFSSERIGAAVAELYKRAMLVSRWLRA
jgi:glycosyltransferase involved in cell wall biosynthesis